MNRKRRSAEILLPDLIGQKQEILLSFLKCWLLISQFKVIFNLLAEKHHVNLFFLLSTLYIT